MPENGLANVKILEEDLFHLSNKDYSFPIDRDFTSACRCLSGSSDSYWVPQYLVEREIVPFKYEPSNDFLVLFNGDRVSTAIASRMMDTNRNIHLFCVNAGLGKKLLRIRCIAKKLGLPLVVVNKRLDIDDPFYGMRLANTAMAYAVENGYSPKIYIGCFDRASVFNNERKDWKYCTEFIGTYKNVVKKYIVGADILRIMPDYSVVDEELTRHKDLIRHIDKD